MKKILITLTFIFSLNLNAQKQFEGSWTSETSDYTTTIIASDYAVLKVFNFSFEDDNYIEEKIIEQNDNEFITKLYNKRNGYEVLVKYYFSNKKLYCRFFGDFDGVVQMYKK